MRRPRNTKYNILLYCFKLKIMDNSKEKESKKKEKRKTHMNS